MTLAHLLAAIADFCRRRAVPVLLVAALLAGGSGWLAATRLGVTTDTDALFSDRLAWRQRAQAAYRDFPQLRDLVIAVVQGATPEEADATASGLVQALAADTRNFTGVRQPDAAPYFARNAFLFLDEAALSELLDRTIDAQPFLGQLASDPSARGLFATLALVATGVARGTAVPASFRPALAAFERTLGEAASGSATPLSWQRLLGGKLADLAGPQRIVLAQARLDLGALEPGGRAIGALRAAAGQLEFVKSGRASVRVTGAVALADEEFATVAEGMVSGLVVSSTLVLLWLVLAVRSWRLIVAIVATSALGLLLTTGFAALAVGMLNLISVAFAVLFVGIAVDFAIQFCVRYREQRRVSDNAPDALIRAAMIVGPQMLLASTATAIGFLAFLPTSFRGVAELGLIAGVGMLIAFVCTMTFLPAMLTLVRPGGEQGEVGFAWAAAAERVLQRRRVPVIAGFLLLALAGAVLLPRLQFDSDPLHTKDPSTEAMRTLRDLMANPLTTPYRADVMAGSVQAADALAARLAALPLVADVLTLSSLVPANQNPKLALVADAANILGATLAVREATAPVNAADLRLGVQAALAPIEQALPRLAADDPLRGIAGHLRRLADAPDATLLAANAALTRFLPLQLNRLRTALSAGPVVLGDVPGELARDWILPDGRVRVQASAVATAQDAAGLRDFVAQVHGVAPDAGGSAVSTLAAADTIVEAFRTAAIGALVAITLLLLLVVRRLLDVALVIGALLTSALLTVLISVLLPLPLNFANIIALPLLLGVGVSFNIYFVMNWRAGAREFLGTATARAVLFSALVTASAFGALAASGHPGTASMGALLLWSLGATLLVTLVLLPVVLGWRRPGGGPRGAAVLALGIALANSPAGADTLRGPVGATQGDAGGRALYRLDAPTTGSGRLEVVWTDGLGRLVQRQSIPLDLKAAREISIPLDMRRAVVMQNRLVATLQLAGLPPASAETSFVARAPAGWSDWQTLMWQTQTGPGYVNLRGLGVPAGMVPGIRGPIDPAVVQAQIAPLVAANTRWYVENIATDFYSAYHRWTPEHASVTWLFDETKRRQRENPDDPRVLIREPSLSDPAWLARVRDRLGETVRQHAPYRPLFYNLGDEAGIADLAAAWDFDFSPESLAGFRLWLRGQYRTLEALNGQWASGFASWDAVMPPTTIAAMRRGDQNYSAWADFKAWMDVAFVRALRVGTDAVRAADPAALAAIGGAQVPGWGGYDYTRLVGAVDLMEIYDVGNNIDITRSLNPALTVLTTSFGGGAPEAARIWHTALQGARGLIIWDDSNDFLAKDGTAAPRGLGLAGTLRELRGGIGAQLIASVAHEDAVAILYSPATHRTQWLLARLPEGERWVARNSEAEHLDNPPHKAARWRAARLLRNLGVQPRWLSPDLLTGGVLRRSGIRLLVLPEVLALSDGEAAEIRAFAARGGTVLSMGSTGLFDGRSRRLARPQLAGMAPASALVTLPDGDDAARPVLAAILARAKLGQTLRIARPDGAPAAGIVTRVLRNGAVLVVAVQRDADAAQGGHTDVVVSVPAGHVAYDMRAGVRLSAGDRLALRLVGGEPAVLALAPGRLPPPVIAGPARARAGELLELRLGLAARSPAADQVLRVEVLDPSGAKVAHYSGNAVLRAGKANWTVPFAVGDAPGLWQVRVTDMLSGASDGLAVPLAP